MAGATYNVQAIFTLVDQMSKEVDAIESSLTRVGKTMQKVGGIMSAAITLPMALVGRQAIGTALQADRLTRTLEGLAGGADEAAKFVDAIGQASQGTVSKVQSLEIANRALTFGVVKNGEEMANLTEIAIALGRAQGLDAATAVSDLTTALSRQSPMILDNLGITLKMSEAYQIYADKLGVSVDSLNAAQKAEAFRVAALEKGMAVVQQMGGIQEDASASVERLTARISDAGLAIGQALLPSVVSLAEGVASLAEKFASLDEGQQKTIVAILAIVAAAGPLITVIGTIISGIGTLNAIMAGASPILTTFAFAAQGATTSLSGFAAVAATIVVPLAALAATITAVVMAVKLHNEVVERTADVGDAWTQMLNDQVEAGSSATEIAQAYASAQEGVNQAYEDGGLVAKLFIDKQSVMNTNTVQLSQSILQGAESYEDYTQAIGMANTSLTEAGAEVGNLIPLLSEQEFLQSDLVNTTRQAADATRNLVMVEETAVSTAQQLAAAEASAALGAEQLAAAQELAASSFDTLSEGLDTADISLTKTAATQRALAIEFGQSTQLAHTQEDALVLLSLALEDNVISQEDYIEAGQEIIAVSEDSVSGYADVKTAVDQATGGYFGFLGVAERVPIAMSDAITAHRESADMAVRSAEIAEEMAERRAAAWETFAGSVSGAVGRALEAFQSGNAEMLAEQQASLAQMLIGQADTMVAMGQITADQATGMKAAIAGEFGIMVDEGQVTTDALLGMFGDWAEGGATSADDIVSFLTNIGDESEALVQAEVDATQSMLDAWEEKQAGIGSAASEIETSLASVEAGEMSLATISEESSASVSSSIENMASTVSSSTGAADAAISRMSEGMQSDFAAASSAANQMSNNIIAALNRMPSEKRIRIITSHDPDGDPTSMGSPDFKLLHSIERVVDYAANNPVIVRTFADKNELDRVEALFGAAGVFSGLGGGALGLLKKRTMDPLEDKMEGINSEMEDLVEQIAALEAADTSRTFFSPTSDLKFYESMLLQQQLVTLEQERADAAAEYVRMQEKALALEKQQEDLAFLQQQAKLLELIKEQGLDAGEILGGIELGLGANLEGIVEAMTRAMQAMIGAAEDELGIASPSKVFGSMADNIMHSMANRIGSSAQFMRGAMNSAMREVVVEGARLADSAGNVRQNRVNNDNSRSTTNNVFVNGGGLTNTILSAAEQV